MLTQVKALDIYKESNKEIDSAKAIKFIKDNWWWISLVGEKIFKWFIALLNKRKFQ